MDAPKRPLGLFLMGGGALGAWQAGALEAFADAGVAFDKAMGFSIGAFHAAAVAFDRMRPAVDSWRALDGGILRFSPRLLPRPALFSQQPVRDVLSIAAPDGGTPSSLKMPLCLVTAIPSERRPDYARYFPGAPWDDSLEDRLLASAAIPAIFPPVRIAGKWHIDGGVPLSAPMSFDFLADCAEVWTLELVREDELGRFNLNPYYALDQGGREGGRELMDEGVASLAAAPRPPLVRRLFPSRRLDTVMLDFSAKAVRPMIALGRADAESFLRKGR